MEVEFSFEKLKVYQRSLDFIDKIFNLVKSLPKEFRYAIGDNLLRAGLSIANNLAEGSDKISPREKSRYYSTASDSARECISVFNVLFRQKLLDEELYEDLRIHGREITSMIHSLISSL